MAKELQSAYREHDRVLYKDEDRVSLTRQEFSDESDINSIMKRFEKTGMLPANNLTPKYLDLAGAPNNLQDVMNIMNEADAAFQRLPAQVRKEFDNDPVKFTEFAMNKENLPKLREWGLAEPEKAPEQPMRVEVVNQPEQQHGVSGDTYNEEQRVPPPKGRK